MPNSVHEVRGVNLDAQTRCAHFHGSTDIIAIKMKCCGEYYACKDCHIALAGHQIEVHDRERGQGRLAQGERVIDQAPEHAGSPFGALHEQRPAAAVRVGQALARQFAVFQLERRLDPPFQGDGGGDSRLQADRRGQAGDQDVPAVLDIRDDPLLALDPAGGFQSFVFWRCPVLGLVLLQPATGGDVDHVAEQVGILPPAPADVRHPDRGRVAV